MTVTPAGRNTANVKREIKLQQCQISVSVSVSS